MYLYIGIFSFFGFIIFSGYYFTTEYNDSIDVIDTKKKICIELFNKIDEIKNNIPLISYIQILEDIKTIYEL